MGENPYIPPLRVFQQKMFQGGQYTGDGGQQPFTLHQYRLAEIALSAGRTQPGQQDTPGEQNQ